MRFDVISVFPGMFSAISDYGVSGRALRTGLAQLKTWDLREFARDPHRCVDDRPYGGGPGMVMKVEPLRAAIGAAKREAPSSRVAYLTPQGRAVDQDALRELSKRDGIILVCGRYEGIDERLVERDIDEEWSIGDYVLSGGEFAAMVLMDSTIRLLPGALGDDESADQDSYVDGLLDFPPYTRPEQLDGQRVPNVLLSGDHEAIRRWRLKQSLGRTWERRPDLLARRELSRTEQELLDEFIQAR